MDEQAVTSQIMSHLVSDAGVDSAILDADTDLFRQGLIDSLGLVELIAFCEQEFDVTFGIAELTEENLASARSMARLVLQHRQ
jgi:acyl carrier protein